MTKQASKFINNVKEFLSMPHAIPSQIIMPKNTLKIANDWKERILPRKALQMVDCLNVAGNSIQK